MLFKAFCFFNHPPRLKYLYMYYTYKSSHLFITVYNLIIKTNFGSTCLTQKRYKFWKLCFNSFYCNWSRTCYIWSYSNLRRAFLRNMRSLKPYERFRKAITENILAKVYSVTSNYHSDYHAMKRWRENIRCGESVYNRATDSRKKEDLH